MSEQAIQPGHIWPPRLITADSLLIQWQGVIRHRADSIDLTELAYSEADWEAWKWNADEALRLNQQWPNMPSWMRHTFLPQDRINLHMLRAYEKLLCGWQQWLHLPSQRSLLVSNQQGDLKFLLLSAWGRLESARLKEGSLTSRKGLLRQFSLRQRRFFQHLAALLMDLDPLVTTAQETSHSDISPKAVELAWHAKELTRIVNRLEKRPLLGERIKTPRLEVNRLLAVACLYHEKYLKTAVSAGDV